MDVTGQENSNQTNSVEGAREGIILDYHYELKGKNIGPVSKKAIENLINNGTLDSENLIWRKGYHDWQKIRDTDLYQEFFGGSPPPITGYKVDNTYIWILAFAPLIGLTIEQIFFPGYSKSFYVSILINSGLAILDDIKLKNAGHKTNNLGWAIFFVPVYMWRRANLVKQSKSYFWVWILSCLMSVGIAEETNSENESFSSSSTENIIETQESAEGENSVTGVNVGNTLHTSYFDIVVNKVSIENQISTGNEFTNLEPEEGIKYLVINATYKNTDTESRMVTEGSVWINYNGKDYQFDKAETILAEGWGLFLEQINPLTSKSTNLVFKLPSEMTGAAYWQPGRADESELIYLGEL